MPKGVRIWSASSVHIFCGKTVAVSTCFEEWQCQADTRSSGEQQKLLVYVQLWNLLHTRLGMLYTVCISHRDCLWWRNLSTGVCYSFKNNWNTCTQPELYLCNLAWTILSTATTALHYQTNHTLTYTSTVVACNAVNCPPLPFCDVDTRQSLLVQAILAGYCSSYVVTY